tara:strand:- start:110 stop:448 length:339 start_codon:yes stop_codon:yes gene_type:complete
MSLYYILLKPIFDDILCFRRSHPRNVGDLGARTTDIDGRNRLIANYYNWDAIHKVVSITKPQFINEIKKLQYHIINNKKFSGYHHDDYHGPSKQEFESHQMIMQQDYSYLLN